MPGPTINWVTFGIITDTHIDASYAGYRPWNGRSYSGRDTDNVKRARSVIQCINIDATNAGCSAVTATSPMPGVPAGICSSNSACERAHTSMKAIPRSTTTSLTGSRVCWTMPATASGSSSCSTTVGTVSAG